MTVAFVSPVLHTVLDLALSGIRVYVGICMASYHTLERDRCIYKVPFEHFSAHMIRLFSVLYVGEVTMTRARPLRASLSHSRLDDIATTSSATARSEDECYEAMLQQYNVKRALSMPAGGSAKKLYVGKHARDTHSRGPITPPQSGARSTLLLIIINNIRWCAYKHYLHTQRDNVVFNNPVLLRIRVAYNRVYSYNRDYNAL